MIRDEPDYFYDPKEAVNCRHCDWSGLLESANRERVISSPESWHQLAGRDGYHYNCPNCGWLVKANYNRMS